MAETAQATLFERTFERERLRHLADGLAIAVAVSLPWSTTASGILIALWLLVLLPTLSFQAIRHGFGMAAGGLPAALCLLALVGMLWADVAMAERLGDFKGFLRLLCIALLLIQFQSSDKGRWVLGGFLVSCTALLLVSWLHWLVPLPFFREAVRGVPVKDYIIQSGEFLICAYALGHLALDAWGGRRPGLAFALVGLALLFLANIAYVAPARSTLIIFAAFVLLFGFRRFGWKGLIGVIVAATALAATTWLSSPILRERVLNVFKEIHEYRTANAVTSSGVRLEF
jgi:O-antigen ligase